MKYGTPEFNELLLDMIQRDKRHDLYKETCESCEKMKPHIYGTKPVDILNRTRPREPEEVKKYRLENYEATTKATAAKALTILSKIFNPELSEIKWKDKTNNAKILEEYALEYYPQFNSVVKFMAEAGTKRMIADANGAIAIRPRKLPENELQRVDPIIILYGSHSIWWVDDDCWVIHTKEEDTNKGILHYFSYYDKNIVIDFIAQVFNSKDVSITETFFYVIDFKEPPIWYLQGDPESTDSGLNYFVSFFEPALPFWNYVITHDSDVFGSYISHLFPIKVEITEECDFVFDDMRCEVGKIKYGDGKIKDCPSCHGSGFKRTAGPYGVHQITSDKLKGANIGSLKPVDYVTVPTEPTKMLEERVDALHLKGLAALNMDVVDKVGANQSGIAKVIDRGELYNFLSKVASVMYDTHLTNIFYYFNLYMFSVEDAAPGRDVEKNLPEISKPVKFDISTIAEMTNEYEVAKKADINPEYLRQKQISIASKEFANNPDLKQMITLAIELDPLPGLTVEEADTLVISGIVSKRDAVLHFQMSRFIFIASTEKQGFYQMPKDEKIKILNEYAEKFIKENKATIDTSAIDTTAGSQGN